MVEITFPTHRLEPEGMLGSVAGAQRGEGALEAVAGALHGTGIAAGQSVSNLGKDPWGVIEEKLDDFGQELPIAINLTDKGLEIHVRGASGVRRDSLDGWSVWRQLVNNFHELFAPDRFSEVSVHTCF